MPHPRPRGSALTTWEPGTAPQLAARLEPFEHLLNTWGMKLRACATLGLPAIACYPVASAVDESAQDLGWWGASAAIIPLPDRDVLLVAGKDRVKFLQGLLTNDLRMPPGTGCLAAMLTAKGKLQFDARVHIRADDVMLDLPFGYAAIAAATLERYCFREDVQLLDRSAEWAALLVAGPRAGEALAALGVVPPGTPYGWCAATIAGYAVDVTAADWLGATPSTIVWVPVAGLEAVAAALMQEVRGIGGTRVAWEVLERLRIDAGVPRFGIDIDTDTIPLEAPLAHMVGANKGCYLGQEIIARVDARGAVSRHLVALSLDAFEDAGAAIRTYPAAESETILGHVTSVAHGLKSDQAVALGWVKRGHAAPGTRVRIGERGNGATIVAFP